MVTNKGQFHGDAVEEATELAAVKLPGPETAGSSSNDNTVGLEAAMSETFDRAVNIEPVERVPSVWDPMNKLRLFIVCLASLANGFSDGGAGAIIPHMETHYHIGYAVVSLVFVGQAIGFILTAVFFNSLRAKLGWAKVFGLGNIALICGFLPVVSAAPYALIPISFILVGFGAAVNISVGNLFCGSLQNSTILLGLLHGCYGVGATASPLLATVIVTTGGAIWSRFYLINLGFAILLFFLSVWSFWGYDKQLTSAVRDQESSTLSTGKALLSTLRAKIVILGAIFIFAYQGAEVSISGWIISFLIATRDGAPASVGYVSSGFWGGITVSRFLLSPLAQRWGETPFIYALIVGAFAFQLLIWFVPNIIGNAVATAVVGVMLGPIYPCATAVLMRNMTTKDALKGIVAITAIGSLGGAVVPFITGLLAQTVGTFVLHPICIFQYVVMVACWYGATGRRDKTSP